MFSCYDDYILDYDYDSVYFTYPINVRTLIVGEGMKIEFGVVLGGVMENKRDRVVKYQIDTNLISPNVLDIMRGGQNYIKESVKNVSELKPIPSNYYMLSDNNKFIIEKGKHSGSVTLKADSAKFLADSSTINASYAIAIRLTEADADTILESNNYTVIGLRYENMLFGNYWHGGVTEEKDASGNLIETISYLTKIPSPDAYAWNLKTIGPMTLTANGVSDKNSSKAEFAITLNGENIEISSLEGATYEVLPDGISTFNRAKLLQNRKIFLSYKYQNEIGNWCYAKDTLTFRNRIRDGINEWQDENPSNYN